MAKQNITAIHYALSDTDLFLYCSWYCKTNMNGDGAQDSVVAY